MPTLTEKDIREKADEWGRLTLHAEASIQAAAAIEKEVKAWLKKCGRKKVVIEGSLAKAIKDEKFASREIGVADFFAATREIDEADRNECLKVEVKKAEKLLGADTVNRISTRRSVADIRLELIGQ